RRLRLRRILPPQLRLDLPPVREVSVQPPAGHGIDGTKCTECLHQERPAITDVTHHRRAVRPPGFHEPPLPNHARLPPRRGPPECWPAVSDDGATSVADRCRSGPSPTGLPRRSRPCTAAADRPRVRPTVATPPRSMSSVADPPDRERTARWPSARFRQWPPPIV